jgi:hypothetical protein
MNYVKHGDGICGKKQLMVGQTIMEVHSALIEVEV